MPTEYQHSTSNNRAPAVPAIAALSQASQEPAVAGALLVLCRCCVGVLLGWVGGGDGWWLVVVFGGGWWGVDGALARGGWSLVALIVIIAQSWRRSQ